MTAEMHELAADSFHLLTIGEYAALGETEHGYTELVEASVGVTKVPRSSTAARWCGCAGS